MKYRSKKFTFLWLILISLISVLMLILNGCADKDEVCCLETGGIQLDFSSLPANVPLAMFTINDVVCIRVFDEIKCDGTSLWCYGGEEYPPASGTYEDAKVLFLFSNVPCNVCKIIAEVDGHGPEARIEATQQDGTTQIDVCPGDKQILELKATADNPFTYALFSGTEAEWISIKLE